MEWGVFQNLLYTMFTKNDLPNDIKLLLFDFITKKTDLKWKFVGYDIGDDIICFNFASGDSPKVSNSCCFKLNDFDYGRANLDIWIKQAREPYATR